MRATQRDNGAGRAAVSALGFCRVEAVHMEVRAGRLIATATGTVHRYPHTVRSSLATARRLIAAGVPLDLGDRSPAKAA
ncbi:MAG: hypothetical protein AB7V43_10210 [Acidimicrobiia bacterium]